jgi:hypothetical protein
MSKIVSKSFSKHVAEQVIESLNEPANNIYYVAVSKHTPYAGGDDNVPDPNETNQELQVRPYQEIIFGKKILPTDVNLVVPRHNWTTNTAYAMYDNNDPDLYSKAFYAAVDAGSFYYVYKVLDNNGGAVSTVQPSSTVESACNFITTGDGYKWKLIYKMPEATFEKFATSDYMPVITSANVAGNSVSGAIDVVKVSNAGAGYVSVLTGSFTVDDLRDAIPTGGNEFSYRLNSNAASNSDFYTGSSIYISAGTGSGQLKSIVSYEAATRVVTVNNAFSTPPSTDSQYLVTPNIVFVGDGQAAAGYAVIASNSTVNNFVSKVVMVNRGSNYTYAEATVRGNTGGVAVGTSVSPVIPPVGGHGKNAPQELGSDALTISVQLSNNEGGYISTSNDYRQIMILKDPYFDNVTLTLGSEVGTFSAGETISQVSFAKLIGTVTTNTSTGTLVGLGTDFNNALLAGDTVLVFDTAAQLQSIRTVDTVTNSTYLQLTSNNSFNASYATLAKASVIATGIKEGNVSPYATLTNATPKFVVGRPVIGSTSGAFANITAINVNEKNYNSWNTFDNRTRISYTANTLAFANDSVVYQTEVSLSNAYFHSANSTYLFLTSEKGPINADPNEELLQISGSATYTLGSVKYTPDIVKNSGDVIYIENSEPISRSNSQSEAFRIVLQF